MAHMSARRFLAPPPEQALEPGPSPTFSVAIAAYQAEATVGDAVASALAQSRPPLDVVVCDDGSTDGTAAALERFAGRITVVRQENRGEAAGRFIAPRLVAHRREDVRAPREAALVPGRLLLSVLIRIRPGVVVYLTFLVTVFPPFQIRRL